MWSDKSANPLRESWPVTIAFGLVVVAVPVAGAMAVRALRGRRRPVAKRRASTKTRAAK